MDTDLGLWRYDAVPTFRGQRIKWKYSVAHAHTNARLGRPDGVALASE